MDSDGVQVPGALWPAVHRQHNAAAWPPHGEADVERFVAAVRRHRLLPLAAAAELPADAAAAVQRAQRDDAARVAAIVAAQDATIAQLQAVLPAGEWIAIKGLDYRRRLYRDAMLREMDDIDLLVRPGCFDRAVAALAAAGYAARPGAGPLEASQVAPGTGVVVDLYRCLIQPQRVRIDYDALWESARTGGDGVVRMGPAYALACHALVLANLQYVTHLRKFLDLWLLSRDAAVVDEAIAIAARWRMRRAFYAGMHLLGAVFPDAIDAPWRVAVDTLLRPSERRTLVRYVLPRTPVVAMPSRPRALWRKFGLIDGVDQRLRFVAAHCVDGVRRRLR